MNIQKPFLKWIGGKTQLIKDIIKYIPDKINNYHEIFLGGGSILFLILSLQREGKINIKKDIYAYDLNEILINTYKNIQQNKDELYCFIQKYMNIYENIDGDIINKKPQTEEEALSSKESYYYWIRKEFNNMDNSLVEKSALFIILNKLCFRGMYREGPNGFNVPFGHYKKTPTIITEEELNNINNLIKNVKFIVSNFKESIKKVKKNDFVYLDPPYVPENKQSFVGYTVDGFTKETHLKLFELIDNLNEKGIKILLSNSNVKLVTEYFKEYKIEEIEARRAINSKNPASKTIEVLIINL
jgi:DNA adenine methylase